MKTIFKHVFLVLFGLVGCTHWAYAQGGGAASKVSFVYSGRLVTETGAPVEGQVQLEVRFFDAATGGSSLGGSPYSFSDVDLSAGVFSIEIQIDQSDINVIFPNPTTKTWIEITDVTNSKTYLPRQSFNVVPYALKIPVDTNQFSYTTNGYLSIDAISMTQVTGLSDALAAKANNVAAGMSTSGFLTATDWARFDAKQAPITSTSIIETGSLATRTQDGLRIKPWGIAPNQTGELRFEERSGGDYVGFKAPDAVANSLIWTLPSAAGAAGQVLTTSATGVLSWTTPSSASITGVTAGTGLSGGGSSGNVTLNIDVGTSANKIVQLDATAKLPAVDGSALSNINAAKLQGQSVSASVPVSGQVLKWNGSAWAPGPDDGGVAGAISNGSNLGTSTASTADIFDSVASSNMRFRRLKEGDGVDLTQSADDVTLAIADDGVTSSKILDSTISANDLANDAVTSTKILNGTITDADIASNAAIADTKLATIATAGKVSGSAINAGTLGGSSGFAGTGGVNLQSAGATGSDLRFFSNNNTNYLGFRAPNGVTANTTWTLPAGDGGTGHVLSTGGNGTLSWIAIPSAPVSSVAGKTGAVTLNADDVTATASKMWLSNTDKSKLDGITAGADMLKSTYDSNADGKVNSAVNADQLGGQAASYYTDASNLALGTVAYARLPVGTAASTVAAGDDPRFSNARTPNGSAGGDLSGTYPNPTLKSSATVDADRPVGTNTIKDSAITSAKLAADAVDSSKILNGAIGTDDVANSAITTAKLAADAVDSSKIANSTITDADIASNAAIVDSKLAAITTAGKVSGSAITSGTISGSTAINTTGSISSGAITTSGTVTATGLTTSGQAGHVFGPAGANTGEMRMLELAATGTDYVGFKAPDNIATSRIWTLPSADGANGQVLQTNGAGVLSWSNLTSSQWTTSGSNIFYNGGKVGIGTSTPTGFFDVQGGNAVSNGANIVLNAQNGNPAEFTTGGHVIINPGRGNAGGVSGSVGIGTSTPTGFFDVRGGSNYWSSGGNINLYAQSGKSSQFALGGDIILQPGTGYNGARDGRVGIGTASPNSLLSVGASSQFQVNANGNLVAINNVAYTWPSTQGGASTVLTNNGSGTLTWTTPSSGTITGVTAGTGLTGGGTSGGVTLNVDVGTTANKIVRLDATAKLPAVDGSALTNLTPGNLASAVSVAKGGTGVSTATVNQIFAGPTTGTSAAPSFRSLVGADMAITATSPLTWASSTTGNGTLAVGSASTSTSGILSSTDWNTFNNKVSSQWATSGSDISYTAGKVGIGAGTSSPSTLLHLKKTSDALGPSLNAASETVHIGINTGGCAQALGIGLDQSAGGASGAYLQGKNHCNVGLSVPLLLNPAGGNVGIGTTNPSVKLQVSGGQIAGAYRSSSNTTINWNDGNVQTTSAAAGTITFTAGSLVDGATYMLTLTNATGGNYSLTGNDANNNPLSFKCNPACPVVVSANKHTVMNLVKAGSNVYVAWVKDFQ